MNIQQQEIKEELEAISTVYQQLTNENIFVAPPNYFNSLTEKVLYNLKEDEKVNNLSNSEFLTSNSLDVPEDYFNNFSDKLLSKIKAQESNPELEGELWKKLSNKNIFAAPPTNYFDTVASAVNKQIDAKQTKVLSLFSFKKFAAAAAIVGVVLTAGYYFLTHTNNQYSTTNSVTNSTAAMEANKQLEKELSTIEPEAIKLYLANTLQSSDEDLLATHLPKTTTKDDAPEISISKEDIELFKKLQKAKNN